MTNWKAWIKRELWFLVRFVCYALFIAFVAGFFGIDPFDAIAVMALGEAMSIKSELKGNNT